MSSYFVLKAVHIISAAVLFGTGLGIAFFKWVADRSGKCRRDSHGVRKDCAGGLAVHAARDRCSSGNRPVIRENARYPLSRGWLAWSLALFCLAGLCWIPDRITEAKDLSEIVRILATVPG